MSPEQRRDQVVAAAAELFDSAGYTGVTMGDIAQQVGVAKPTLYHYFDSKDDILLAIHEEFIDLLIGRHDERRLGGLPPEKLLQEAMGDILELMETHRGHVRVFFEHHRELPAEARVAIRTKRDHYERTIQALFEEAADSGAFVAQDSRLSALAMFGMCNWAYQWYRPGGTLTPRQVARRFWRLLICGVGSPALVESLTPVR
ncbi:MAG: transcriptional regulator, TetR family [Marmoricola sp.]|nr:transcriptional regulator, TetR family [Marmoricola sp.]